MLATQKTIESTIGKIVRDLNITGKIDNDSFVEWIGEALSYIGAYGTCVEKDIIIPIDQYTGKFPCDYYKPIQLLNNVCINNTYEWEGLVNGWLSIQDEQRYAIGIGYGLYGNYLIGYSQWLSGICEPYKIEFNTIKTTFCSGFIGIRYLAVPLDNNGYPLIPDDVSVDTALFWYVAKMLAIQGKLNNPEFTYMFCDAQWKMYCKQARATINFPDPMLAEKLGYNWNSFVPTMHLHYPNRLQTNLIGY